MLDAFCVDALIRPNDLDCLVINTRACHRTDLPEKYAPVCVRKVYSCNHRGCDTQFFSVAGDTNPQSIDHNDFIGWSHAPGPWTLTFPANGSLQPFANWYTDSRVHGTLDDLQDAGYGMEIVTAAAMELEGLGVRAPYCHLDADMYLCKWFASYHSRDPAMDCDNVDDIYRDLIYNK